MKVILVGGAKGIGHAIYTRLSKDHCVVRLSRSTDPSLDLRWESDLIDDRIGDIVECLDGVDWLVVSAGMGAYTWPHMENRDVRELMMAINYHGPVDCFLASRRALMKSRGKVLFIGSTVATRGAKGLQHYAATKGALDAYVRSAARGLAKHGVAMNVLSPGWVDTPMTAEIEPKLREAIIKSIPLRRMIRPEEVAEFAARILESPHALTGQILEMSGGA